MVTKKNPARKSGAKNRNKRLKDLNAAGKSAGVKGGGLAVARMAPPPSQNTSFQSITTAAGAGQGSGVVGPHPGPHGS